MSDASAMGPKGIAHHQVYKAGVADARFEAYRADPKTKVASAEEFERMRQHLIDLQEGVEVQHSFVDSAGQVFDCVPIDQQPSLRGKDAKLPEPPSLLDLTGAQPRPSAEAAQLVPSSERLDRFGNAAQCPPGFVPVRRVTLAEMARFRTLEDFRRKIPPCRPPSAPAPDDKDNHRYAYVQQDAASLGGHNFLNVWSPAVGDHQIFSLSQHWYTAGADASTQTLEVGWQVYPGKYGHSQPVLFVYWTADDYNHTGAYNLDGPGFVQTNPAWTIGGALSPVSADASQQYEIEVAVYLYQNNWWLYLGGLAAANTVGYFPTSIYSGGAMASNATTMQYGGETVCDATGPWPGMGSGQAASAGWMHAAYHRDIFYFPTAGGALYSTLAGGTVTSPCYTQSIGRALPPWNTYFFYGGAGGGDC